MRIPERAATTPRRLAAVAAKPLPLLAVLAAVELATVAWLALETPHNGWVWHSGGDATEYWASSWSLAHGLIPQAIVSYALPLFYAWVPLITGSMLVNGLPVIVLLQALVVVPLVLLLVWAVADRLYGRAYAAAAAAIWAFGPLLMLLALKDRYRPSFEQNFLAPHWAGLTNMADLPSVAVVLATMWAALRAADSGRVDDGLLAGALTGVAIGLKPANAFAVPALLVLFVLSRRLQTGFAWAGALVPALLTLAIWKAKGLGHLPITSSYEESREALGATLAFTPSSYVPFNLHHLKQEFRDFQEVFWSIRLLEFLAVAGIAGAIRRVPAKGIFLATWFAAFCIVKGSSDLSELASTSYFRYVEPGLPAFVLLIPAIGFLWPVRGRRVAWIRRPESRRIVLGPASVTAAVVAAVPLLVVAAARPARGMDIARASNATEAVISTALTPRARRVPGGVELTWRGPRVHGPTKITYAVLRTSFGDGCDRPDRGAVECYLVMDRVGTTRARTFVDRPARGAYTYRVAAVADYLDDPATFDLMLLSKPVAFRAP
jgi:hypothetical protein